MVRWLLLPLIFVLSSSVYAKPDLGSYIDLSVKDLDEKIRVYRDHKNNKKWYLAPAKISIGLTEDTSLDKPQANPGYSLDLMRYKGRKGSGDADKFWIKSVLHVEMQKEYGKAILKDVRKAIKAEGYKVISLKLMPEVGVRVRVLMGDIDGSWSSQTKWSTKSIALALPDHIAQILWNSAENEQQLMSIEVETAVAGMRLAKQENQDKTGHKKNWNDAKLTFSQSIPIQLNAQKFPERFKRIDLDANIDFGYTGLDVFCFDFLEGNYPELYAVLVDIKIKNDERDLVKQLRFDHKSEYRYRIDFGVAKEIDKPYLVRLTYIDKDGKQQQEPWFKKHGELMLDVTRYQ